MKGKGYIGFCLSCILIYFWWYLQWFISWFGIMGLVILTIWLYYSNKSAHHNMWCAICEREVTPVKSFSGVWCILSGILLYLIYYCFKEPDKCPIHDSETGLYPLDQKPVQSESQVPWTRYCSNCGTRIDLDDNFCKICGNKVSSYEHR